VVAVVRTVQASEGGLDLCGPNQHRGCAGAATAGQLAGVIRLQQAAPYTEVPNRVLSTVRSYLYRLIRKEGPRTLEHISEGATAVKEGAAQILQPLLNEEMMKTLVDTLRIPRANVEALIEKIKGGGQ